jgi:predicted permease
LPPLLQHLSGKLGAALSVESRGGTTNRRQSRLREALIVAQIALAFVLLTGAGLLTMSFARVLKVDPGFRPDQLLTAQINLPTSRYGTAVLCRQYVQRILREVDGLPGVKSVAVSSAAPFTGHPDSNVFSAEGYQAPAGESLLAPFQTSVAGDFFGTYGFTLRDGRFFNADDADAEPKIALIDERFARKYWPGQSAVGRRIRQGTPDEKNAAVYTVIGVVGAVKQADLAEPANVGAIYLPYRQEAARGIILAVRTDMLTTALAPMLHAAALRVDPEVPVFDVKPMTDLVHTSLGARRTPMVLAGVFAVGAWLLAAVGIYGVLAYTVAQRRREIGIRLALGAVPGQVHRLFLRMGVRLVVIGLGMGAPLVYWLGRILRGQLFGVEPANPLVLAGGAAVVAAAALLAAFIPARRAAATPAMEALRAD